VGLPRLFLFHHKSPVPPSQTIQPILLDNEGLICKGISMPALRDRQKVISNAL
jgi:hypothetical protein